MVKFEMTTGRWNWIDAQYAYALCKSFVKLPSVGPIKNTSKDCLIMAKEDSIFLNLRISYPDLAFHTSKPLKKMQDIEVKRGIEMGKQGHRGTGYVKI